MSRFLASMVRNAASSGVGSPNTRAIMQAADHSSFARPVRSEISHEPRAGRSIPIARLAAGSNV